MIAGVDGCKAGWLVAMSEGWPCAKPPVLQVCLTFKAVLEATDGFKAVVVDIPIGLPHDKEPRLCDITARKALAPDGCSRVFPAPTRQALTARDFTEFLSVQRKLTGKGLPKQVFCISPKIGEVDAEMTPKFQGQFREFHPELAWKRLAGRVLKSKHGRDGIAERLAVLAKSVPGLIGLARVRDGGAVGVTDILDAIVGLSVAHGIATDPDYNRRLPAGESQGDDRGLRMEIWY